MAALEHSSSQNLGLADRRLCGKLTGRNGSVAASGLKNLNDCFQSDRAVDARFLRFSIELSAPGPQAATEFSCFAVGNRPKPA
jgi:hypothetical protein